MKKVATLYAVNDVSESSNYLKLIGGYYMYYAVRSV